MLVVFNVNSDTSRLVKDYYQTARGIPAENIVQLFLPDSIDITVDGITLTVGLAQETDIIRDFDQDAIWAVNPTFHAWKYYLDYIATPIKDWISSHNLISTIRYIVLCKGVPFKIQARGDWSGLDGAKGNLSIDGLLCLLNTENYDSFITNEVYPTGKVPNPYFNKDPNYSMEYRFLPDHFTNLFSGYTVKLSYLVSHLNGVNFNDVKGIIDRSINPDMSGEGWWVLDGDGGLLSFHSLRNKLVSLDANVLWDYTDLWLTNAPGNVIGYVSNGIHAEDDNPNWHDSTFWVDLLEFQYANGAIAASIESFNANSISTLVHRAGHSLITQFIQSNLSQSKGTGFTGNTWEPGLGSITDPYYNFPYYAMGYNQVDAAYLATPSLAWQNVFVGDPLTRIYDYKTITIASDTTITGGDFAGRIIVPEGKTLTIANGSILNFKRNSFIKVYGNVLIESQCILNFNAYSKLKIFETGNLILSPNAIINFKDNSTFETLNHLIINAGNNFNFGNNSLFVSKGNLTINAGAVLNFNDSVKFKTYGSVFSKGLINNKVIINSGLETILEFDSGDSLDITNTTFNNFGLGISTNFNRIKHILIKNSKFNIQSTNNSIPAIIQFNILEAFDDIDAKIINTEINGFRRHAIIANLLRNFLVDSCVFLSSYMEATAIDFKAINNIIISYSFFRVPKIFNRIRWFDNPVSFTEENLSFFNCTFEDPNRLTPNSVAIAIENNGGNLRSLKIENCIFNGFIECIYLLNLRNLNPIIRNNSFIDFKSFGISAANGSGMRIINNQFSSTSQVEASQKTGIFLSQISYPHIISNNITLPNQNLPGAGIMLVSSNGEIRGNTISGFKYGIELGSSSPNIGANVITANNENGLYLAAFSNPNLSYTIINDEIYPLSGYNTIRENGLCNFFPSYSEIFLSASNVQLKGGCNTIADDREDPPLHCNYLYLIDGEHIEETIYAGENYWGEINNHNPEGRFGNNITVDYEGYLNEPCYFTNGSEYLLLTDENGEAFDTIYSSLNNISQLSDIESRYAIANSYFYAKVFSHAKTKYENIIELYGSLRSSLKAYLRLYEIAALINSTPYEFSQLGQYFSQKAIIQSDSVMISVLKHLTSMCLVWSKNYEEALSSFEMDIQNAQTNELTLYRTIDILTTSLLLEPDTVVSKRVSKYLITPANLNYSDLISELLKTRGKSDINELIKLIPKEFVLYQNYPNPLNSTTTIKFDLPKSANVNLSIFDILGRKVKTIVNEMKDAGTYQFSIDVSELSSGIYFYQLQTDEFNLTRKMLMLK